VIGFAIAGGVEAWTSSEAVSELLDGHGPREIGYSPAFGFVSPSCSYSAIATARTHFKKGVRRRRSALSCSPRPSPSSGSVR
jgi:uncharacterized membrane protein YraQ (UPF0718 family)